MGSPSDTELATADVASPAVASRPSPAEDGTTVPFWQRLHFHWGAWSRRRRIGVLAVGLVLLLGGATATASIVNDMGGGASGNAEGSFVVEAAAGGGSLLIELDRVSLGLAEAGAAMSAEIDWVPLAAAPGTLMVGGDSVGPTALAVGNEVPGAATTGSSAKELRVVFDSASAVVDGALLDLVIDTDLLWIQVPAQGPDDVGATLRIVFDVPGSLVEDDTGIYLFRPKVVDTYWVGDHVRASGALAETVGDGISYEQDRSGMEASGAGGASGGSVVSHGHARTGSGPAPPQAPAPGSTGDGAGAAGEVEPDAEDDDGTADGQQDRGKVTLLVRDAVDEVRNLNVTFSRVAFEIGEGSDSVYTVFEGGKRLDLVAYRAADAQADIGTFQMPTGRFGSLRFAFGDVDGNVNGDQFSLKVPQRSLVIEAPFDLHHGDHLELLVDFDVDASVVRGVNGWEFRPVVGQHQDSRGDADGDGVVDTADPDDDNDGVPDNEDADRDGDGKIDAKPRQYRDGGDEFPSLTMSSMSRNGGAQDAQWSASQRAMGAESPDALAPVTGRLPSNTVDDVTGQDGVADPSSVLDSGASPGVSTDGSDGVLESGGDVASSTTDGASDPVSETADSTVDDAGDDVDDAVDSTQDAVDGISVPEVDADADLDGLDDL